MKIKNKCCICDSENKVCNHEGFLYCQKHYILMKKYGRIPERIKTDKNKIEILGKIAKIYLYNEKQEVSGIAIIDREDVEKVINYKWHTVSKTKYVQSSSTKNNPTIHLHHLIMGFNKSENKNLMVDHINRNREDNRKENLRIVDFTTNAINKGIQSNNTSGYPGVHFGKERGLWEASVKLNRTKINLGRFVTKEEAIQARIDGEIKYFGYVVDRNNDINTVFK